MMSGKIDITASLKRIAWAFGCAKHLTAEEAELRALLLAKVATERAAEPARDGRMLQLLFGGTAVEPFINSPGILDIEEGGQRLRLLMRPEGYALDLNDAATAEALARAQPTDPPHVRDGIETVRIGRLVFCREVAAQAGGDT